MNDLHVVETGERLSHSEVSSRYRFFIYGTVENNKPVAIVSDRGIPSFNRIMIHKITGKALWESDLDMKMGKGYSRVKETIYPTRFILTPLQIALSLPNAYYNVLEIQ